MSTSITVVHYLTSWQNLEYASAGQYVCRHVYGELYKNMPYIFYFKLFRFLIVKEILQHSTFITEH